MAIRLWHGMAVFGYLAIWLYGYMAVLPWHGMAVYGYLATYFYVYIAMGWYDCI